MGASGAGGCEVCGVIIMQIEVNLNNAPCAADILQLKFVAEIGAAGLFVLQEVLDGAGG